MHLLEPILHLTTLFNAAQRLEPGNTSLAAKSIEGVLSQLLPIALNFLARTFKLDKLPVLVRAALKALRTPVDKGINWVVDKIIEFAKAAWKAIKAGGKAVGQAGRDAVGAVRGWMGFHKEFHTVDGETHELYVVMKGGQPQLMRASSYPKEILDFLNALQVETAAATPADPAKLKLISEAITEATALTGQLMTRTKDAVNTDAAARAAAAGSTAPTPVPNDSTAAEEIKLVDNIASFAVLLPPLVSTAGGALPKHNPASHRQYGAPQRTAALEPQYSHVQFLTHAATTGGTEAAKESNEMNYVKGQNWVRMHLVSAKLGGPGTPENWVPAPTGTNTGHAVLDSFETTAKNLAIPGQVTRPGATAPQANTIVLWMNVDVTEYHAPVVLPTRILYGFAKYVKFEYGMYRPPLKGEREWQRIPQEISKQIVYIDQPPRPAAFNLNDPLAKPTALGGKPTEYKRFLLRTQNDDLAHPDYGTTLRRLIQEEAAKADFTSLKISGDPNSFLERMTKKLSSTRNTALKTAVKSGLVQKLVDDIEIDTKSRGASSTATTSGTHYHFEEIK